MSAPSIGIVIPTWNSAEWLPSCLAALARQTRPAYELIVADSHSSDGTRDLVPDSARLVELPANRGFAAAANAGWRTSRCEWVALLNPDAFPAPDWIETLERAVGTAPPDAASIASLMVQWARPDRIDDAGDLLSRFGSAIKRGRNQSTDAAPEAGEVFSACAGAALYRYSALEIAGGFDESFETYLEDVDLGFRLRLNGWRNLFDPRAVVRHVGGASGLPRRQYVRQMTRNRLLLLSGCLPSALLFRLAPRLLWGQLYFLLAYRRPWASLRGYASFASRLRVAMARRRSIQADSRLTPEAVAALLESELGEPPLRRLLSQKIGR